MAPRTGTGRRLRSGGFTLAEACVGVFTLGLLALICFTGILCAKVASAKAREQNIVNDFLIHYAENIKALPFPGTVPGVNVVAGGSYLNLLWNGSSSDPEAPAGADPCLVIPASGTTNSLNTASYLAWHPDLQWLTNANPTLQVTLVTNLVSGAQHDITVTIVMTWTPPLGHGGRQQSQIQVVRAKNL